MARKTSSVHPHYSFKKSRWNAITTQLTATMGDSRSPTRDAFQHRPYSPLCCAATDEPVTAPGPALSDDAVLKMDGYRLRKKAVEQMKSSSTTSNEGKSKRADIFCVYDVDLGEFWVDWRA